MWSEHGRRAGASCRETVRTNLSLGRVRMLARTGRRESVSSSCCDGVLEAVRVSAFHEELSRALALFIEIAAVEAGMNVAGLYHGKKG